MVEACGSVVRIQVATSRETPSRLVSESDKAQADNRI